MKVENPSLRLFGDAIQAIQPPLEISDGDQAVYNIYLKGIQALGAGRLIDASMEFSKILNGDSLFTLKMLAALGFIESVVNQESLDRTVALISQAQVYRGNIVNSSEFTQLPLLEQAAFCTQSAILFYELNDIEITRKDCATAVEHLNVFSYPTPEPNRKNLVLATAFLFQGLSAAPKQVTKDTKVTCETAINSFDQASAFFLLVDNHAGEIISLLWRGILRKDLYSIVEEESKKIELVKSSQADLMAVIQIAEENNEFAQYANMANTTLAQLPQGFQS